MISAQVIKKSINPHGQILITQRTTYPRFIHGEVMTHRAMSKNAASSRAIPFARMVKTIREKIARPAWWGSAQKGMQTGDQVSQEQIDLAIKIWDETCETVIRQAERLTDECGLHKSIPNRLLEPWAHMTTLKSFTERHNFYGLRAHKDAEPSFQVLAYRMLAADLAVTAEEKDWGEWHLPYEEDMPDGVEAINNKIVVCVARAAWVSYGLDGQKATREQCESTYAKLLEGDLIHASPSEHVAVAEQSQENTFLVPGTLSKKHKVITNLSITGVNQGNFRGWTQWRKLIPRETITSEMIDLEEILRNKPTWIDSAA